MNNIYRLRRPPTELEKKKMKKQELKMKLTYLGFGFVLGVLLSCFYMWLVI